MTKATVLQANFALDRQTTGAIKYAEIDEDGGFLDMRDAKIGTLYLRKTALEGKAPQRVTATITMEE